MLYGLEYFSFWNILRSRGLLLNIIGTRAFLSISDLQVQKYKIIVYSNLRNIKKPKLNENRNATKA